VIRPTGSPGQKPTTAPAQPPDAEPNDCETCDGAGKVYTLRVQVKPAPVLTRSESRAALLELVQRREAALASGGRAQASVKKQLHSAAEKLETGTTVEDSILAIAGGSAPTAGEAATVALMGKANPFGNVLRAANKTRTRVGLKERVGNSTIRARLTVRQQTRETAKSASPSDIRAAYEFALYCVMSASVNLKANEDAISMIEAAFQTWFAQTSQPLPQVPLVDDAIVIFCESLSVLAEALKKDTDGNEEFAAILRVFIAEYFPKSLDLSGVQQVFSLFSSCVNTANKPKTPLFLKIFARFLFYVTRDLQATGRALLLKNSLKIDALTYIQTFQYATALSIPAFTRAQLLQRRNAISNHPFYNNAVYTEAESFNIWAKAEQAEVSALLNKLPVPTVEPFGLLLVTVFQATGLPTGSLPVQCTLELQHTVRQAASIFRDGGTAVWREAFSMLVLPLQDTKISGLTISLKDKDKKYGSLFFLPNDLIDLAVPRRQWFSLLQKKKLSKNCPYKMLVELQFFAFPTDKPLAEHYHFYTLCVSEILDFEKETRKTFEISKGVSQQCRWILDEYAQRYGIHRPLRDLIELNYYVKEIEQHIATHYIQPSLEMLEKVLAAKIPMSVPEVQSLLLSFP